MIGDEDDRTEGGAIVNPPNAAAAALSGCPSISDASANTECGSSWIPRSRSAEARQIPATVAADDEPRPRASGIALRAIRAC